MEFSRSFISLTYVRVFSKESYYCYSVNFAKIEKYGISRTRNKRVKRRWDTRKATIEILTKSIGVPPSEKMKAGGHSLFLPQEQIQISRLTASGRTEDILPLQTAAKSLTSFPAPGRSRFHPLERETR